jgi:hypothetical protein
MKFTKSTSIGLCLSVFLVTSCSSSQSLSPEVFCARATNEIVAYQKEYGLRLLGGVFFANTTGLTIFTDLEDDIATLQNTDPVKYYNLDSDQDVMNLCKIEVK